MSEKSEKESLQFFKEISPTVRGSSRGRNDKVEVTPRKSTDEPWIFYLIIRFNYYALPILNILVPHVPQVPVEAGLPFFMVI
jgi:hypothetical protein